MCVKISKIEIQFPAVSRNASNLKADHLENFRRPLVIYSVLFLTEITFDGL